MVQSVSQYLFAEEGSSVFAVLDGASVPDLLGSLDRLEPEYECLYRGELQPDLQEVAPYLVRLQPGSEFAEWVISQGWGKHWGIFALTGVGLREMRRHFRTFLMVYDSAGKHLYFRYYDPRVLRVYLPTCNAQELATVFGPVASYLLEAEQPNTMLRFRSASGSLVQQKIELAGKEN
jgi:hypothetical protein